MDLIARTIMGGKEEEDCHQTNKDAGSMGNKRMAPNKIRGSMLYINHSDADGRHEFFINLHSFCVLSSAFKLTFSISSPSTPFIFILNTDHPEVRRDHCLGVCPTRMKSPTTHHGHGSSNNHPSLSVHHPTIQHCHVGPAITY